MRSGAAALLCLVVCGCSGTTNAGPPTSGTLTAAPRTSPLSTYDCGHVGPRTHHRAQQLDRSAGCIASALQVGQPATFVEIAFLGGTRSVTSYRVVGTNELDIELVQNGLTRSRDCLGAVSLTQLGACGREPD